MPFHTWLPDAAGQAPAGAAVLLVGVLDKVGTYGMLRFCIELFPGAAKWFTPVVLTMSVVGIVYGAVLAIGQVDMKRLIAYTSISHFGFITLGIFAMTTQGQTGATLYMVNHGFSTGALFLVAGFLIARRGSARIDAFGGVQKVAPLLAGSRSSSRACPACRCRGCRRSCRSSWCWWAPSPATRCPRSSRPPASSWPPSTSCGCTSAR